MNTTDNSTGIKGAPKVPDYGFVTQMAVMFALCLFGFVSNCLLLHVTRKNKKQFYLQHVLAVADLILCLTWLICVPPWIYWELKGMSRNKVL